MSVFLVPSPTLRSCRYPDHSLIRFLVVSNSLDLILDVVLELWSAVVGQLPYLIDG